MIDPESILGPFRLQAELPPLGPAEVEGDTALISAQGIVYVFERNPMTEEWTQVAALTPGDSASAFGQAVATDGTTVVVGAEGAAYVFVRTTTWHQVARIAPADTGGRRFGISVDVDRDHVIVGAAGSQPANLSGAAYVFRRGGDETSWQQVAQLDPPTQGRFEFGYALALSGTTAIVASRPEAPQVAPSEAALYFFERDPEGPWRIVKRYPGGEDFTLPIRTVDLKGDTAVVAGGPAGRPFISSHLVVLERHHHGDNAWGPTSSIFPGDPAGWTARVDGNYIVAAAGSEGLVWVLARNEIEESFWSIVSELRRTTPPPQSGPALASVSGDTITVVWMEPGPQPIPNNAVQVLVSDVDSDGIRDARDPCPRDPFNNTVGGCQRDSGAYPILNDLLTLRAVTTDTRETEFIITATFTNTGETPIRNPFFEVADLSGGNTLINADGSDRDIGATLSPNVGDGVLSPGERMTVRFSIRLASFDPFSFFVNFRGTPTP